MLRSVTETGQVSVMEKLDGDLQKRKGKKLDSNITRNYKISPVERWLFHIQLPIMEFLHV